jgi:hypothetical protein
MIGAIEAILADIERLDAETHGQFRQASDREATDTLRRIIRRLGHGNTEDTDYGR